MLNNTNLRKIIILQDIIGNDELSYKRVPTNVYFRDNVSCLYQE